LVFRAQDEQKTVSGIREPAFFTKRVIALAKVLGFRWSAVDASPKAK
jgi:hypothetical protein